MFCILMRALNFCSTKDYLYKSMFQLPVSRSMGRPQDGKTRLFLPKYTYC